MRCLGFRVFLVCLYVLLQAASSLRFGGLQTLVDGLSTLVGFLLGLFVSTSLSRWWALRQQLTQLSAAVYDVLILACCHLEPHHQHQQQQQQQQQEQQQTQSNSSISSSSILSSIAGDAAYAAAAKEPAAASRSPLSQVAGTGDQTGISQAFSSPSSSSCSSSALSSLASSGPYWCLHPSRILRRLLRLGCVSFHLVFDAAQGRSDLQYLLSKP